MPKSIYTAPLAFRIGLFLVGLAIAVLGAASAYSIARDASDAFHFALIILLGLFSMFGLALSAFAMSNKPISRQLPGFRVAYKCEHCGAALTAGSDVSPLGDVRCHYCQGWFNIHKAGA